jgi:hypothetical protein
VFNRIVEEIGIKMNAAVVSLAKKSCSKDGNYNYDRFLAMLTQYELECCRLGISRAVPDDLQASKHAAGHSIGSSSSALDSVMALLHGHKTVSKAFASKILRDQASPFSIMSTSDIEYLVSLCLDDTGKVSVEMLSDILAYANVSDTDLAEEDNGISRIGSESGMKMSRPRTSYFAESQDSSLLLRTRISKLKSEILSQSSRDVEKSRILEAIHKCGIELSDDVVTKLISAFSNKNSTTINATEFLASLESVLHSQVRASRAPSRGGL